MTDDLYRTGDIMLKAKASHTTILRYARNLGLDTTRTEGGQHRWTKDEALQIVAAILKGKPRYKELNL